MDRSTVLFASVLIAVAGLTWAIKDPLMDALGLSMSSYSHPLVYGFGWLIHTLIAVYAACGILVAMVWLIALWREYTRMEKK